MQRDGAAQQCDESGKSQNDDQDEQGRLRCDAKDSFTQDARENDAERVANSAPNKREQELFGGEQKTDGAGAGADGFHQADFGAALDHRRGRGCAYGERGSQQRGEGRSQSSVRTRVRMLPSPSATRRITCASTRAKPA